MKPADLTAPYWVSMGALSITVLAGAWIAELADAPVVAATRHLIAGLAVVFWGWLAVFGHLIRVMIGGWMRGVGR